MFIDRTVIHVKSGDGGRGCMAFRREKFVPHGGPSGGDGGNGGSVLFRGSRHLNTLLPFKFRQHINADRGAHGTGSNRHGKNGEDLIVDVPLGTVVTDLNTGEILFDIKEEDTLALIAKGGDGGRGNARFKTSVNQAPRRAEPGWPGEEKSLRLELKVLADIGLIGYPNAGKSTLISSISDARPKIADYPFTTLSPQLGVVAYEDYSTLVVADIPGLIEGAHEGTGLGHHFLRHVERCKLLVHLVDVSDLGENDPVLAFQNINRELSLFEVNLADKPQIAVASKIDSANTSRLEALQEWCSEQKIELYKISSVTGEGIKEFKYLIKAKMAALGEEI